MVCVVICFGGLPVWLLVVLLFDLVVFGLFARLFGFVLIVGFGERFGYW